MKMFAKKELKARLDFIKSVLDTKPYPFLFLAFLAAYLGFNFWINDFGETLPNLRSYRLWLVIPYLAVTFAISVVVALNLTVIAYKLRQLAGIRKDTGFTAVAMFGGILGGACPGCFVGVFPAFAGVFGITATLSSLPIFGFEVIIPALLIAFVTLYLIANPLTCKVQDAKGKKK